jgi:aspartate carbamoyltransferase catalytic subunit
MREYAVHYGLHVTQLDLAAPDAIVMHPGPMNRGIEVSSEIADGGRSLILDQVTNGVAVRMAVLYLLAGGAGKSENGTKRGSSPTVREGSVTAKNGSKEKKDRSRR